MRLDEITVPSGGPWGSTFVDLRFEDFVRDLVGAKVFSSAKETSYWIELLESWEQVKLSQTADDSTRTINLAPLLEVLDEGTRLSTLVETYNTNHRASLKMRGRSTVIMSADFVRAFFRSTFTKITSHCETLIEENRVDHIFLVGGFAESELLQALVKSHFASSSCKVVVPVRPGLAVLRGAVLFGMNQDVFASRRARFTYGKGGTKLYDSSNPLHKAKGYKDRLNVDGLPEKRVYDTFCPYVKVGDKLPTNHKILKGGFTPIGENQTRITMDIVSTPLGNIDFTTDPSAK